MLRIRTANIDFGLGGDEGYLVHLLEPAAGIDVLCIQEAKNVAVAAIVEKHFPGVFEVLQDRSSPSRAGCAVVLRKSSVQVVGEPQLVLGSVPRLRGRRFAMLPRWFWVVRVRDLRTHRVGTVVSAHWPPGRFGVLQPGYTRSMHAITLPRHNVVIGCDANQPLRRVALKLHMAWRGPHKGPQRIVGLMASAGTFKSAADIQAWGVTHHRTDHPYVTADVEFTLAA